jgi:hypothetical protein
MAILSHPAFGPKASLAYITVGALIDVWAGVWYFGFVRGTAMSDTTWFWLVGFFLTGLVLITIGLLLGPISQFARRAELPPGQAVDAEAAIQQTAAATPHPVVPNAAAGAGQAGAIQPPAGSVPPSPATGAAPVTAAAPPATTTGRY